MWQEASFDPGTIDRELGMAASLGFTSLRVFLHDLVYQHERTGFLQRLDRFLTLAHRHGLGTLLVFFDGVWDPHPRPGAQPEPRPRVHNSRWVQSPGAEILRDPERRKTLRPYLQQVMDALRDDPRVDGWDLFNEPDNPNPAYARVEIEDKEACALALLREALGWAREVDPSQPLTTGVWHGTWSDPDKLTELQRLSLESSDVVSFHHYGSLGALQHRVASLRRYGRPLLCTEWMARGLGSTFDPHLGWFADENVGAYCWGLVAGRSQTQYPWDSWVKPYAEEPDPWHHDLYRPDGTPFAPAEIDFIRTVTRRHCAKP